MLQRHDYESFKYLMFKINKGKPNKKKNGYLENCVDSLSPVYCLNAWTELVFEEEEKKNRFQGQPMPNSHVGHLGNATSSFTTTDSLSDSDRLFWGMIFFFKPDNINTSDTEQW